MTQFYLIPLYKDIINLLCKTKVHDHIRKMYLSHYARNRNIIIYYSLVRKWKVNLNINIIVLTSIIVGLIKLIKLYNNIYIGTIFFVFSVSVIIIVN